MDRFLHKKPLLLGILLILACILRLYRFNNPIADWHSWRQVDTSAVSRNFVAHGFDILHPRFDDLSNVASGKDNPEGYRFVEFPLYNIAQAGATKIFGGLSLEQWGRVITIISSLFSTLFLFLIVRRHSNAFTAYFSSLFFAVLPFNIYFGRTIFPDPSMVMAVLGAIYFFDLAIKENVKYYQYQISNVKLLLAIIFTASALLLKPYAVFFTLPMIYLAWRAFGWRMFTKWQLWLFALLSIFPLVLWRIWMTQYPEGIPVNAWLFNGGDIRFKGAYFYWIFADRLCRLILGYWGIVLFVLGILINSSKEGFKKDGLFLYSFLISSLLYVVIIARGNVQHDYYQILIIPSISIFLGLGAKALFYPPLEFANKMISRGMLIIICLAMLGFSWYFVRDYFNINNSSLIKTGEAVNRITPKDAKIIAPYNGDTTILYSMNRKGWASFQSPIPELVKKGATHLVLINPVEKDHEFQDIYKIKIISETKDYILFDLKQQP